MAINFRHIQRIASAAATFGSTLQIGDRLDVVFSKLQSLLVWRQIKNVIVSAVSGGASSTADINIATLTIDPLTVEIGSIYRVILNGVITKPFSNGTTVNLWIKIGTNKVAVLTFTPTAPRTATPFSTEFLITVRSIGASGNVYVSGTGAWRQTATTELIAFGDGPVAVINNTVSFPITVGFNFSNSNASNNVTVQTGAILQI